MARTVGRRAAAALVGLLIVATACTGGTEDADEDENETGPVVEVISSRPEYVTGGDALVAVALPDGLDAGDVKIEVGGDERTASFAPDPETEGRLLGLVSGLPEGDTDITAQAGDARGSVTVTDHPVSGPLFAGEPLDLFACTTESFGLAPSSPDDGCAAPTKVTWQYVDAAGARHDLADPTAPPADAATVTVGARVVPFVIRTETGVINRAVYQVTALDPAPDPTGATVDPSAWNRRLVYRFGGGCGVSFTQGFSLLDPPSLTLLGEGYVMATATFNTFQVLCNDMLSAETMAMVKEHVIETWGEPVHTIGEGGSGGAIQQLLIAQDYPGLLDGIAPLVPFPDALSISGGVYDCALLTRYYRTPAGGGLTPAQRTAVNGHAGPGTCQLWNSTFASGIDPSRGCLTDFSGFGAGGAVPFPTVTPEAVYDAVTNPDGWRCTVWEANVAVTGRDPDTGFARPGYDNEGIQYGLDALNAGVITPDQFLDLNQSIGGFDGDGQPAPERSVVPDDLVARAYETGRVAGSGDGLLDIPIILVNVYTDDLGDIHDRVRSFSILDRLAGGEGGDWPATVSLWSIGLPTGNSLVDTLTGALGDFTAVPTHALDQWLTAAEAYEAGHGGTRRDALAATKPDSARSRCQPRGAAEIVGDDANDDPACVAAFPVHEEPRMAAGEPRRGDVLKCALRPVEDSLDLYDVRLGDAQIARLAEIFPTGVCDYDRPGVGEAPFTQPWYDFTAEE
jgi:Tannase-like family of unknown function (DUF6351)